MALRPNLLLLALVGLCGLPACKKKADKPPKELINLPPDKACRHFFGRIKRCASTIHSLHADKLKLEGQHRTAFIRQRRRQLSRALSNLDLVCERYGLKTRKQLDQMDRCYRARTCDGFARCFAAMADAEIEGGGRYNTIDELRKRLKELKKLQMNAPRLRGPGPGAPRRHTHSPAMAKPRPRPKTQPMTRP